MTTMASKVPFISTDGIPGTQAGAGSCKTIAIASEEMPLKCSKVYPAEPLCVGVLTIIDRNGTSSLKKKTYGDVTIIYSDWMGTH